LVASLNFLFGKGALQIFGSWGSVGQFAAQTIVTEHAQEQGNQENEQ
jgi:hypothetical protein